MEVGERRDLVVSRERVQLFEEAVSWRAGLEPASSVAPIAFLSHIWRPVVDVSKDVRPAPAVPGIAKRGVNGGGLVRPTGQVSLGSHVSLTTSIADRYQRRGHAGMMDFVVLRTVVESEDGLSLGESSQWMIYA